MNLNPKKRFQKMPEGMKFHADLVDNQLVQDLLQISLAEMATNQSINADAPAALRDHYKMEGARDFIRTFLSLSSVQDERTPITSGTLLKENPKPHTLKS